MGKLKSLDLINKRELIQSKHKKLTIKEKCELLSCSRSSYYYKPKPISKDNINILHTMDEIYTDNPEYGYRFIHQQLRENGYQVGVNRVLKYMGILGIQALHPRKKRLTSVRDSEHKIYPYLLKPYWEKTSKTTKKVRVDIPNEVWSGDITYIRTNGGFMYLAAVIDWSSRAILSYKISNSMDATLATDVLKDALSKYPKPKIFNSDQGSRPSEATTPHKGGQYTSKDHTDILNEHKIQISMDGKGRSIDNIMIERFFRTLKHNNIYISDYKTIKELKGGVAEYIYKYNFKRFVLVPAGLHHSSLNYKKPMVQPRRNEDNVYMESVKMVA